MPPLLEIKDLETRFFTRHGIVKAVNGVSLTIEAGETVGVVGESGCGKSVMALSVMRVLPPGGRVTKGEVIFDGESLHELDDDKMASYRGRRMAMVLQDSLTALDPVFTVHTQVGEPFVVHLGDKWSKVREKVIKVLKMVRVPAPEDRLKDYPHQFSGGMRQRVASAMALTCEPQLLIADEPTTSLDVTSQAQYLALLKEIQARNGMAIWFITHDFGIVANLCDRVVVMYAGSIVERAATLEIFDSPKHPYSMALMGAVPQLGRKGESRLNVIGGEPPDLVALPQGCPFAPRCDFVMEQCWENTPPGRDLGNGRWMWCWLEG